MGNRISSNPGVNAPADHPLEPAPPVPARRIIGITGGIGMGKTTISNYLAEVHRLPVLDADLYARDAVTTGSALVQEIAERYGPNVLLSNGQLNRVRLGEIVFQCKTELLWLEKRIHPYVRDRIQAELAALDPIHYPTVVVVIPLLFEARMTDLVTEVWVVHCGRSHQVQRIQERDIQRSLTLEQIHDRINSQMPIEEKLRRADVVLENSSTPEALFHQVDQALHSPVSVRP